MFQFLPQETCQLCGSRDKRPFESIARFKDKKFVWRNLKFDYVICERCGFVYMDPVPSAESYQRFYRDYYWYIQTSAMTGSDQEQNFDANQVRAGEKGSVLNLRHRRIPRVESMLMQTLGKIDDRTRIMEIGCAWGMTLAHLHGQYGAQVFGVEPSDQARAYMAREFPFITMAGQSAEDLFENSAWDGQMDVIIFSHCLEMIIDQNRVLAAVHRMLADGGIVYIDTPNLFWQRALNPCHPYVYSRDTLTRYLRKHQFRIEHVQCCAPPANSLFGSLMIFLRQRDPYLTVTARKNGMADESFAGANEVEPGQVLTRRRLAQRAVSLAELPPRVVQCAMVPLKKAKRFFIPAKLQAEIQ